MSNKTIDGVPRELLASFAAYVQDSPNAIMRARVKELRALLDAPVEPVEVVQADNAEQALTLLDFALSFALCNMDHGGTRRDVKKAKAHLEAYLKFKAAQPQGEPVATVMNQPYGMVFTDYKESAFPIGIHVDLYAEQPAPISVKYDDVLLPFMGLMRNELHANSDKGDREGWLGMTSASALAEVEHHHKKLFHAVACSNPEAIREHAADVANCAMMVADVCGVLKV